MQRYLLTQIIILFTTSLFAQTYPYPYEVMQNGSFGVISQVKAVDESTVTPNSAESGASITIVGKPNGDMRLALIIQWTTQAHFPPYDHNNPGNTYGTFLHPIRAQDFTYTIPNLQPNTTYKVRSLVFAGRLGEYHSYYSPIYTTFTTLPADGSRPINNNTIDNANKVLCSAQDNSFTFLGSTPTGGLPKGSPNRFRYSWQTSAFKDQGWVDASGTEQNFDTTWSYSTWQQRKIDTMWVRRIVWSGSKPWKSVSEPVYLTYEPDTVWISQEASADPTKIFLTCDPCNQGNIVWLEGTGDGRYNNAGNSSSVKAKSNHYYRVLVSHRNGGCETRSDSIGISPADGDGNMYGFAVINGKKWFINNLRTTKFNDGTSSISFLENKSSQWATSSSASYGWYNNDPNNINTVVKYGALYNQATLTTSGKNVCPVGWHVATDSDWKNLRTFAGKGSNTKAGFALKSQNWPIVAGQNAFNFNAVAGGTILDRGPRHQGNLTVWWAPAGSNNYNNVIIYGANNLMGVQTSATIPTDRKGISIRCVED